ncbi:MAG: Hpt domain-containing protein, partial [Phormidesmis sp. CAN_BIN44]|nr:Hpt domain-containing protein [Phormidesmis sp. CAN_BIN44]
DTRAHLEAAQAALLLGDHNAVLRAAHHVKGASANVGLKEMRTIASQLEADASEQQLTDASGMLSRLAELLQDLQAFLEQP